MANFHIRIILDMEYGHRCRQCCRIFGKDGLNRDPKCIYSMHSRMRKGRFTALRLSFVNVQKVFSLACGVTNTLLRHKRIVIAEGDSLLGEYILPFRQTDPAAHSSAENYCRCAAIHASVLLRPSSSASRNRPFIFIHERLRRGNATGNAAYAVRPEL